MVLGAQKVTRCLVSCCSKAGVATVIFTSRESLECELVGASFDQYTQMVFKDYLDEVEGQWRLGASGGLGGRGPLLVLDSGRSLQ